MPFDKLFVKIKCTMCDGTRLFKHSGHHDPMRSFKWKSCPYCDHDGTVLIEACESTILEYFSQLSDDARARILLKLNI